MIRARWSYDLDGPAALPSLSSDQQNLMGTLQLRAALLRYKPLHQTGKHQTGSMDRDVEETDTKATARWGTEGEPEKKQETKEDYAQYQMTAKIV